MIARELSCDHEIRLIVPNVKRDAPLGVEWMRGEVGAKTQAAMGVAPREIHEHTLTEERKLFEGFISTDDELVWMVEYLGRVVGIVEVGLKIPPEENGPSISIMLGDAVMRGKGVGKRAMQCAISYLQDEGYEEVNARYLLSNTVSETMNTSLGFHKKGSTYIDEDGLHWQNVVLKLKADVSYSEKMGML